MIILIATRIKISYILSYIVSSAYYQWSNYLFEFN